MNADNSKVMVLGGKNGLVCEVIVDGWEASGECSKCVLDES